MKSRWVMASFWLRWVQKSWITGKKFPSIKEISKNLLETTWRSIHQTDKEEIASTLERCYLQQRRKLLVSGFLRSFEQLDNCPEPDQRHDIVGHLIPLFDEGYASVYQFVGDAWMKAYDDGDVEKQSLILKILTYVFESGLIVEWGIRKALWATIYSSSDELDDAFVCKNIVPLTIQNLKEAPEYDRTITRHSVVFEIDWFGRIYDLIRNL